MSVPISQFIHHHLFLPLVSIHSFSMSVSLLLLSYFLSMDLLTPPMQNDPELEVDFPLGVHLAMSRDIFVTTWRGKV